jgi:hypothetical protein
VTAAHRETLVKYLADLNEKFDFFPETFFLSVTILDQFLSIVKVRQSYILSSIWIYFHFFPQVKPKHMSLIGVTALFLAAKIKEEDEVSFQSFHNYI